SASAASLAYANKSPSAVVPSYLSSQADLYARDPRAAALAWFKDARFGLFLHYGLYSILGHGEWAMYHEKIPLGEYEKLKDQFRAENFDAAFITDLAIASGMKYVTITARHHDSFCLFDTKHSDYNSVSSPAKRDLIAELAEQCRKKSLGLFLYYSYALDWRHPYFYPRKFSGMARPDYPVPEPRYLWKNDADFRHYIDFVHAQLKELLTNYGPLAGIWFDPIMTYYARPDLFPIHETYAMIRNLQPQALITFKQGATGTEDFAAPERSGQSLEERVLKESGAANAKIAAAAWASNKSKRNEICDTLQPHVWGYKKADDDKHLNAAETLERLAQANDKNCNLLMNTGPLGDGSIHPIDVKTLREVGDHIRTKGWPLPSKNVTLPATPKANDGAAGE
ncbi:MAG: alpha-L-fucosidase, partial [Gloeobacteraceae cyanobacterium ES-bin-144]|nr:alpha-L-fucosidase [Verrucomicrobiales bacterium]